jgi:hypothetical protein
MALSVQDQPQLENIVNLLLLLLLQVVALYQFVPPGGPIPRGCVLDDFASGAQRVEVRLNFPAIPCCASCCCCCCGGGGGGAVSRHAAAANVVCS